jgi:hypothetical protein
MADDTLADRTPDDAPADHKPAPDTRPEPKYGQYAPIVPAAAPAPVPDATWAPPVAPPAVAAPSRTRDVVITTVLLLLGVFDVASSFSTFAQLAPALTRVYAQFGIDGSASDSLAAPYGLAINAVRISVLVITVVVALLLISRRRSAFWVPLAGWALAGIVSSILVAVVMLNDPAYLAWLQQPQ